MSAPLRSRAPALGFWTASALVIGNMIGSGTYLLPASLAPYGGASLLGWGVSLIGSLFLALTFAYLARRQPRTGGPYAYARSAFGDGAGFAIAWSYWISVWCGNAAIAIAFAGNLGALFPEATATPLRGAICSIAALWLCTLSNLFGVRVAGGVQAITTILKLLPLLAIALVGVWWIHGQPFRPFNPAGEGLLSVTTATAALTLWAFLGLECATIPADDVADPQRTIPRATLFGTLVAGLITVVACTAVLALLPNDVLTRSGAPFADAASQLWGSTAGYVFAGIGAISCFGALNGWVLMQGQMPMAAARDGLFPPRFAHQDARGTPTFGLLLSSVLATALICANYNGSLVKVFTFAILLSTAVVLLSYLLSALASMKAEGGHAPRRSTQIFGFLAYCYSLFALIGTGDDALSWGLVLLLAGWPLYALRKQWKKLPVPTGVP